MSSTARSSALSSHPDLPVPVEIRPIRTARRLRLRFDEARGILRLTCPARTSPRAAIAWAVEQRPWIDAQIAGAGDSEPFLPGTVIPVEGRDRRLEWAEGAGRRVTMTADALVCGGPREAFPRRIELFLKRLALERLSEETAEIARQAGVAARSVGLGDAATRWGSCSSDRRIRYSWRLVFVPAEVRRFLVAHEVAHLVHMNHGAEFKALEERLFGRPVAPTRALLRRLGPRLRRLGRGG